MAVNKNFVVKNGLEVSTDLIFADANTNKVGIASTAPRTELDVRGGIAATDLNVTGVGTFASELNVGTDGSVLTVLGIGGSVGIRTTNPEYLLDIRSPVSTGQTALYVQGDVEISGDLIVDDISFDDATVNNLTVTEALNVTFPGISTFGGYVGVNSDVNISGTLNVGGATTFSDYVDINAASDFSNTVNISGLTTLSGYVDINNSVDISADLNVTGIATIATISVVGAELTNLNVTGITTLGTVQVNSGIVTATSGIVTYYGDGSQLDGVIGGIGINTEGGLVGFGITYLHLFGAGVSTTFYDQSAGIATIFVEGGGGSGTVSISSIAPTSPENGDLWYSIDYGRTFVYYDEVALGIGSTSVWVDAAPFNIGVIDVDDLTVGNLTVTNNVNVSGIVTASAFVGDGSGLTGAGSTVFNDTTTNQEFYLTFTDTTSGIITSTGISTSKLTYNPFSGEVTAVDYNSTSDQSLKTNIQTVDNAIDIVSDLRGVSFDWKETGKPSYGVIAQELEQVLPELVGNGDIKTVNYNGIIGVLIEAVKELKNEVRDLKLINRNESRVTNDDGN